MLATDTGLIRSSITLLVILVNPDRGYRLREKQPVAGTAGVTRAQTFSG